MTKTALIIDDDPDICFMLGEILKRKGFTVTVAYNLFQAKNALNSQSPSIVVLDNTLPDGRGTDFVLYIEKNSPKSKTILITGDYDKVDDEYSIKGIAKFIKKPFTLDKFRALLESIS